MTLATATAPIEGLKALFYPPKRGEHWLSINLALVDDVAETFAVAKGLGFKPELAQISSRQRVELHALLFYEQTNGDPMTTTNLDDKIDYLADQINPAAIRHPYGGRLLHT
ncbi:MAG: hypothetical protein KME27_10785 [Lyngbya sp. HA4199-MV5]|jgi:hypothetical protein|nr:hypothetical protein [Lyngbya sp. HA4199-MV5]